jgi:hypothetical protein
MTSVCYHTQLLLVEMGSWELFAQAGFELKSSFSDSWGARLQMWATTPSSVLKYFY